MLVLHLSHTPLAGAPLRICQALRLAGVDARCAILSADVGDYAKRAFELDLVWTRDRDEIISLAQKCDVLHLHNYLDLDSKEFAPIDLRAMWAAGKPMVRHFHSTPQLVSRMMRTSEKAVQDCPIPKLVIAQYPERYFPTAKLVPNVGIVGDPGENNRNARDMLAVGYAPSVFRSARVSRWDTKGYPETVRMLRRFQREAKRENLPVSVDIIEQVPHEECLRRKAVCDIFIDDLVTGSYHLNTLESLALGSATLAYLDQRTVRVLNEITGRSDFPAVNVGLEDARAILLELARDPSLTRSLGAHASEWMREHWAPARMVEHFLDAYRHVCENPGKPFPTRFDVSSRSADWSTVRLPDIVWKQRHSRWPSIPPDWFLRTRTAAASLLRRSRVYFS